MVGMSNFTINPSRIEKALIEVSGATINSKRHKFERGILAEELLLMVRECQKKYGSKTELATESDTTIQQLCDIWERSLSHGLRSNSSVFKNVTDLMSGVTNDAPVFWHFAFQHLNHHEKERFSTLRHVCTNCGKGRALLRAVLNERALERYMLMWLSDSKLLEEYYECWALLRDTEIQSTLPNLAADLSTILFAITIDYAALNTPTKIKDDKPEPIIATSRPIGPVKKINAIERTILDDSSVQFMIKPSSSSAYSAKVPSEIDIVTANIDTTKEYTAIHTQPAEVYSVDDALKSISVSTASDSNCNNQFQNNEEDLTIPLDSNAVEASEKYITSESDYSATNVISSSTNESSTVEGEAAFQKNDQRFSSLDYKILEERCQLLEERVAELSLENHRLRMLTRSNRISLVYFTVSIPKAVQRIADAGRSRRPYYAYEIRISPSNRSTSEDWSVYRRYNEFYRLHKRLQKEYPNVKALDFPPKKKIGNMNADFVEQRRQRLQVYLNSVLMSISPDISTCSTRSQLEHMFPFISERM